MKVYIRRGVSTSPAGAFWTFDIADATTEEAERGKGTFWRLVEFMHGREGRRVRVCDVLNPRLMRSLLARGWIEATPSTFLEPA